MIKNLLSDLIKRAVECFESLKMTKGTIRVYRSRMLHPLEKRIGPETEVDSQCLLAEEEFFRGQHDAGLISHKTLGLRMRGIRILAEINDTGTFRWQGHPQKERVPLGPTFEEILASFGDTLLCGENRKRDVLSICRRFLAHMEAIGVDAADRITPTHVREFITETSKVRPQSMDEVMSALRRLFEHMASHGLRDDGFWKLLGVAKCRDHRVQPCLSTEEISQILGSIDRSSADGKRDFAMICLGAFTGLRAGDVASLRLGDICWERQELRIVQGKTAEPLVAPVPKPILNAIADYVANGRPSTSSDTLFVRHLAPFHGFRNGVSVASVFNRRAAAAGIKHMPGDGKTFHGMRRRLGTEMVAGGVSVDTVAQVLGHKGTRATRQYVSADIDHLRLCALRFDSLGGV